MLPSRCAIQDQDAFPTLQLSLLALVRLAEPIALTSIFPYAYDLVKRYGADASSSALYAGLLISSFALAEALTGMYWGGLSDRIGRKPVLILGCLGTTFSMLVVGFSSSIWMALAGRAFGGLLNGNIGVIQTMVGELVRKPEHEPRAYSIMPGVWAIGTIIGPIIGGALADPAKNMPNHFNSDGIFGRFPYLLPNLTCAALLLISIVFGCMYLQETLPVLSGRSKAGFVSEETPLNRAADAMKHNQVDLRDETYGTFVEPPPLHAAVLEKTTKAKVFTKPVVSILIALAVFSYHSMSFDHLLPVFLEDDPSAIGATHHIQRTIQALDIQSTTPTGLGLSMPAVGGIMSINGIIALSVQFLLFPYVATLLTLRHLFLLVSILAPLPYVLMPLLANIAIPTTTTSSSSLLYPAIYAILTIRNITQIIAYPLLLILLKEACTDKRVLGKVNGVGASVGAAARTLSPPVAGWIYGFSGAAAWYVSAIVASLGAVQVYFAVRAMETCERRDEEEGFNCIARASGQDTAIVEVRGMGSSVHRA